MADTLIGGSTPTSTTRRHRQARSPWRRRSLVVVAALFVVTALVGGRWWATSAHAFDHTYGINGGSQGVDPGSAVHWYAFGALPQVEVTGVEVELAAGSGPAATSVSLCLPGSGLGGGQRGDLAQWCQGLAPVEGADLADWPADSFAALTVVPLTTATVHVVGVRVAFADGWRTGEQTIPVDLVVSTQSMAPLDQTS